LVTSVDVTHATLGSLSIVNDPKLTAFRLGPFAPQVVVARIIDAPLLTDLGPTGLSSLQRVTGDFDVVNTGLSSLGSTGLSNLVSVGGSPNWHGEIDIESNPRLTSLGDLTNL